MPTCLSWQVLNHDATKYRELSFYVVEDAMVGQIKSVANVFADPIYDFVSSRSLNGNHYRTEILLR
jgi:hypothetical protein